MNIKLSCSSDALNGDIKITGSKSESNRLLILKALFPGIQIHNLSNSDDTRVLQEALRSESGEINVHHAGTAMRFLTAYYASREGKEVILTGSERMQDRPIKVLVSALRNMGADIQYMEKEGYPPLKIRGKRFTLNEVRVESSISSQYISALMLIAPSLPNGLVIRLDGKMTSVPYIEMTLKLLKECGIKGTFDKGQVKIEPVRELPEVDVVVESDWSSASYFYSMIALSKEGRIRLSSYKETSFQGDRIIAGIYRQLGVETIFEEDHIIIHKAHAKKPRSIDLDLSDSPDLAQTVAVTCFALGIKCTIQGLHTLRIKETDRLHALKTELTRLGGTVEVTSDSFHLTPSSEVHSGMKIETYDDHRMALAFAPLALKVPLEIADAQVVSKSFPDFWEDLEKLGFSVKKTENF